MGSQIMVILTKCWKSYLEEIPELTIQSQVSPNLTSQSNQITQVQKLQNAITLKSVLEKLINPNTSFLHTEDRVSHILSMTPSNKELRLKVKNSPQLAKNLVININYKGYMDSLTPGVVYFGSKRKADKGGSRVCDFIIPSEPKQYGRMFVIYYCTDSDNYYIRDLGVGQGVYLKLDYSFKLTSDILVKIGESFLFFKIVVGSNSYPNLLLTVFSGEDNKTYCFYAQEQHISPIRIGRAQDCDICINDMLLSKYQASILYSHNKGWMLIDGNLIRQRPSTNGAW